MVSVPVVGEERGEGAAGWFRRGGARGRARAWGCALGELVCFRRGGVVSPSREPWRFRRALVEIREPWCFRRTLAIYTMFRGKHQGSKKTPRFAVRFTPRAKRPHACTSRRFTPRARGRARAWGCALGELVCFRRGGVVSPSREPWRFRRALVEIREPWCFRRTLAIYTMFRGKHQGSKNNTKVRRTPRAKRPRAPRSLAPAATSLSPPDRACRGAGRADELACTLRQGNRYPRKPRLTGVRTTAEPLLQSG